MIITYASFYPDPLNATPAQRAITQGLIDLPDSGATIYGAAIDTADPSASFSFAWAVLYPREGQTATPADPSAASTTLEDIAAVWGDIRLFCVATNTTTGEQSETDPRLAPESAFLTYRIESERRALTLPAIGSRAWRGAYDTLALTLEELETGASLESASINAGGELLLTLTDGSTLNAGQVRGADGADGADGAQGVGVSGASISQSGHLILDLTDGSTTDAGGLPDTRRHVFTAGPLYHLLENGSVSTPLNPSKAVYIAGPWRASQKITLEEITLSALDGGAAGAQATFELVEVDPATFNGSLAPSGSTLASLTLAQTNSTGSSVTLTQTLSGAVLQGQMIALVMNTPDSPLNGLSVTLTGLDES